MRTHCGFSFRAWVNSNAERERDCAAADQADDDGGDDGDCPCSPKLMMMVVMMATVHVPQNSMHALEAKPVCRGCLGTLHNQSTWHVCW